ncbi:MAG: hypothetical protein QXO95_03950 [Candidatus Aenigmatarchaeota archaeon]
MKRKTLAIDFETYERLIACQGILQNKLKRKISLSKTINYLIKFFEIKGKIPKELFCS